MITQNVVLAGTCQTRSRRVGRIWGATRSTRTLGCPRVVSQWWGRPAHGGGVDEMGEMCHLEDERERDQDLKDVALPEPRRIQLRRRRWGGEYHHPMGAVFGYTAGEFWAA